MRTERQKRIVFHPERCVQCHACESACKNWRHTEQGVKWRRVANIWEGDYPQVSGRADNIACMHCEDPDCVAVCPTGAAYKELEHGLVLVEQEKCIGCKACLDACPIDAPQFGADGRMQKCDLCFGKPELFESGGQPCVRTCPVQALELPEQL